MKKLIPFWPVALFVFALVMCKPKEKKPVVIVTPISDTTRVIDTTIIEDGVAPIADETMRRKQKKEKISCGFGLKKLHQHKRDWEQAPGGIKGRKPKPGTPPVPPPPPPPEPPPVTYSNTIYLNFLGKTVSNTMWNVNGTFTCDVSGFGQVEINAILTAVREQYKDYNVNITDDPAVFNATQIGHRVEVVITESWEWYGQAGGVAYIGSFTWSDGSPAFVFSSLLGYNVHNVAEAASHEAGHTLALRHQSDCVNGSVTNQYSMGKIMGNAYYTPIGAWVIGTSSLSCSIQDDFQLLTNAVGRK